MDKRYRHGMCDTKIYNIWCSMLYRCHNEKASNFWNYGERGIYVCDEWRQDFLKFYQWATDNGYEEGLSIDRINHHKGYCADNCRWILLENQKRNRRKPSNSTSGITGINFHKDSGREVSRVVGRWVDENGKQRSKSFSVNKYGYEGALELAVKTREDAINRLRDLGVEYDENHGK